MNTDGFTGKAQAYAAGRPGYPDNAVEYICSLVPPDAAFADIGAGTGILRFLSPAADIKYMRSSRMQICANNWR